jgi:hypothetical protein
MIPDRIVVLSIIAVVVAAWIAAAAGVFGYGLMLLVVPTVVMLVAAFVGAWLFDRRNRGRQMNRYFDENRGSLDAPMANRTWQIPTAYIDHKSGTGPPPGVEEYDDGALEEEWDDGDAETNARRADPAP